MNDLISRQAAIALADTLKDSLPNGERIADTVVAHNEGILEYQTALSLLPSAQPDIKPIDYRDCANAMMKMWMDNVVTDGEYNRIMDKLNTYWSRENGRLDK